MLGNDARLESMYCALKIFRANTMRATANQARKDLKNILVKRAGSCKKVPSRMGRHCEGGFSQRANLTRKISSTRRKQTFQSGNDVCRQICAAGR